VERKAQIFQKAYQRRNFGLYAYLGGESRNEQIEEVHGEASEVILE